MAEFPVTRAIVRKRLISIFVLTVLVTMLLISRLAWIQIVQADQLYEQAWGQWSRNVPVSTARGSIYDSQGRLLAGSTAVNTVAAIPPQIESPEAVAGALAPILEMDAQRIYELITMDRSAIYIKRKVEPDVSEAIREMNIPGIIFFNEEKRYYPGDNIASQVLGFVGMDQGLAGVESYYEDYLSGSEGRLLFPADGRGKQLPHTFTRHTLPRKGYDLHLAIDESIQHILERELARLMENSAPKQAMALMLDPQSGALLAAAAKPDYNPGTYELYSPESWALAPITSSFEPGSTLKMVTLAAVVEEGLFDPDEVHHCPGYTTVNGNQINCWTVDRGGHGAITFYEAVGGSCNPAFIELGQRLGKEKLFQYLDAFGFGQVTGIDYPGESSGMMFSLDQVGPMELATTTFGQGISVTPIQQVMAVTAMINGGYLYQPYIVEEIVDTSGNVLMKREPEIIRQVISEETSGQLIDMMESVILDGTGYAAAIEGYRVAGKTGTAEQLDEFGSYSSTDYIYSLVGFAPVENPQLVLYVAVDGVTRGPRLGVHTSAPLFKNIMEDSLNYLQVSPSPTKEDYGEEPEDYEEQVYEEEQEEH